MMEKYKNKSGKSPILEYELGDDYIIVRYKSSAGPRDLTYTYANPGEKHVETMKVHARNGFGLNTYIKRYLGGVIEERA